MPKRKQPDQTSIRPINTTPQPLEELKPLQLNLQLAHYQQIQENKHLLNDPELAVKAEHMVGLLEAELGRRAIAATQLDS